MSRTPLIFATVVGLSRLASADVAEPSGQPAVADPPPPLHLGTLPPSLTEPVQPTVEVTTSYRSITMTADALSIAACLGGFASEDKNGMDSNLTGSLYVTCILGAGFATPIIHGIRGHGMRAIGSYLIRSGSATVGMVVGIATADCARDDWFCGFDRIIPGMVGGLVVASVIDAAFLTDETEVRPVGGVAWTPVVAPARGGGTIGVSASF
jgi:hypothetical protein